MPYPRTDHNYPSDGWEHVEVVLPGDQDIESKFKLCFPNFSGDYKIALPETNSRELMNETLVVKNPENIMQCVKFHSNAIGEIIASEI